ncbi:hypothetical protein NQ314_017466 [Rhamnusium bicolor]|uniref:Uncharacterized protein n=1 Tax=Rhamnusium bicolor TaxID=1586634 RepID=A0AAV8WW43_9CUCU|nr:hypothetical protein NQ314_017466 [Rhamnusium bicolor]
MYIWWTMAETTDFISRIKVRDLISAYESKSNSVRVEFTRPRAKSVGNVLAKNVVVHLSEFNNLDDVEKALRKIETKLNFYEVYNKAKHVGFQEQLFNILTSIVNIESDAADATTRRKRLIAKTQTLVSFLNQKLPSNVNTVAASDPITYKYTPYSSYIKENGTVETKSKNISENVAQNQVTYSNSIKSVEITNPTGEPFVSVKKLKENFLPKSENVSDVPQKADTKFKVEYTFKVTKPVTSNGLEQEQPKEQHEKKEPKEEDTPQEDKPLGNISVSKLRNLFENKSEKNSKGLEIVTGDKSELSKPVFGGSASNINFPYTERNLGTFRLQRSVSGNYMNYTGLLNRIDINRTNSVNELNKVGNQDGDKPSYTFKNNFDEDSGADSDVEEGNEEQKIVGEVKENSTLSWGK